MMRGLTTLLLLGFGLPALALDFATARVATNLRAEPDLKTRIVAVLQPGVPVEVLDSQGEFLRVRRLSDGIEGYIRGRMLVNLPVVQRPPIEIPAQLGATEAPVAASTAVLPQDEDAGSTMTESSIGTATELSIDDARPLHFLLGNRDITALIQRDENGSYRAALAKLADPDAISVFATDEFGHWEMIAGPDVRVSEPPATAEYGLPDLLDAERNEDAAEAGSNWTPALTAGVDSQLDEGSAGDAFASERRHYQDLNVAAGLQGSRSWGAVELDSQFDFVGVSHRPSALRYSEQGPDAAKFDLSQYQVSLNAGPLQLGAGHVSVGNHALLISAHNTRGIRLSYTPFERLRISGGRLNTIAMTGYQRLLGYSGEDRQIYAAGLEADLLQTGWLELTLGLTWMNGQRRSEPGFDTGEVTDAEKNDGLGASLSLGLFDKRLSLEGEWARSRFSSPADPFLEQGDELVPVQITRDRAWTGRVSLDLIPGMDSPLGIISLRLSGDAARADPLYKALIAFASADQESRGLGADFSIGALSVSVNQNRSDDNVDDVPTILKTRSENRSSNLSLPLSQLWDEASWLPSLSFGWNKSTQKAMNNPDPDESGFNGGSHLPDQLNLQRNLNADWNMGVVSLGLGWSQAKQDNRQPGREQADFISRQRSVSLSWQVLDSLGLSSGLNETRQQDVEQGKENRSFTWNAGLNLNRGSFSLSAQYGRNRNNDSLDLAEDQSSDISADISWSGDFGEWVPAAQLFARYNRSRSESLDREFDAFSSQGQWRWTAGLNLTLY